MARFRSKSCPGVGTEPINGADGVCDEVAGERKLPTTRTDVAAGKCGAKDQVSRPQPTYRRETAGRVDAS